jgi:WD40 repeat protein
MFSWNVAPSAEDWDAGARVAACVTYAEEPVRGTARSAGLSAPDTLLAVIHEVDGQADVWIIRGSDGELALNISDSPASIQLAPPGWHPGGEIVLWAEGDSEPSRRITAALAGEEPSYILGALDVSSVGSPTVNPVDPDQIAVIAAPDGGEFDIFLFDGSNETLTNLTADNTDRDTTPNWSPDGTKLLFRARMEGNSDVWVMDADGSNKVRLTDAPGFDGDPRWSPDGSQILFTTDRTGDYEIFVMNADGSNQRNLTNHPADDEYPSWSPDGSIIAFHSDRHGGISLWLMNADGSEQTNISWLAPVGYPSFRPIGG